MARRPLSLRTHLALLILVAVLPSALLAGVIVWRSIEDTRTRIGNRLVDAARVDAEYLDREFDGTIRVLETMALSPSLEVGNLKTFWNEAKRAVGAQEGWFAVILLTPDGRQLLHTEVPFGEPLSQVTEPQSLQQLIATRAPVVGRLAPGQRDSKLRFPIRVPVIRQGQLLYILTAVMEPESLTVVARSRLPQTEEWTRVIVDSGAQIAARSRNPEQFIGRTITPEGAARMRNPPPTPFAATTLEGQPVYSAMGLSAFGWVTSVSVPTMVLDGPVRASIAATLTGGVVLLLGALLGVLYVSRRVERDFASARDAAAALAEGHTPELTRSRVAEAQQVQASLQSAAQLLHERKRERDEQLQRAVAARTEAEAANRTKDQFLAVLGHELRNPLAPALTALELMKARGGDTLVRERQVLERQVSHMTRLVDDLLDISRLTRGKVELRRKRFELRAAVDRAVDMARPLMQQNGHRLEVAIPGIGIPLDADEDRLVQILVNLLTNAAKYTPPDSRVQLSAHVENGAAVLACEDNGPGVPEELLPTIFEPFAQGPRTIERQQGGLGLGLTLARSLTELHGGTVTYERVSPHGSRFIVRLPLASSLTDLQAGPPLLGRDGIVPRRVLLVDDNVDGREMMQMALADVGHVVDVAADGHSAIQLAADIRPDVAVLDIGLPGMSGYELAQRLRIAHPGLRLVALTGYGQDADAEAARRAGFDAHCTKPVTRAALLDQIASLDASPNMS